jgi:hypothetical protein
MATSEEFREACGGVGESVEYQNQFLGAVDETMFPDEDWAHIQRVKDGGDASSRYWEILIKNVEESTWEQSIVEGAEG